MDVNDNPAGSVNYFPFSGITLECKNNNMHVSPSGNESISTDKRRQSMYLLTHNNAFKIKKKIKCPQKT